MIKYWWTKELNVLDKTINDTQKKYSWKNFLEKETKRKLKFGLYLQE